NAGDEDIRPELQIEVAEEEGKEHGPRHRREHRPDQASGEIGNRDGNECRHEHESIHGDIEDPCLECEQAAQRRECEGSGNPDDRGDQSEVEYIAHDWALPSGFREGRPCRSRLMRRRLPMAKSAARRRMMTASSTLIRSRVTEVIICMTMPPLLSAPSRSAEYAVARGLNLASIATAIPSKP